jgi:hypothetical protein
MHVETDHELALAHDRLAEAAMLLSLVEGPPPRRVMTEKLTYLVAELRDLVGVLLTTERLDRAASATGP